MTRSMGQSSLLPPPLSRSDSTGAPAQQVTPNLTRSWLSLVRRNSPSAWADAPGVFSCTANPDTGDMLLMVAPAVEQLAHTGPPRGHVAPTVPPRGLNERDPGDGRFAVGAGARGAVVAARGRVAEGGAGD